MISIRGCDPPQAIDSSPETRLQSLPSAPPEVLRVDFACVAVRKIRICTVETGWKASG